MYVRFNKEAEKNEDLNDQARAAFKEIEDGKPDALALWERFKQLSLNEFQRIYDILEISFDSWNGEAFYNDKIPAAIKRLEEKVLTEISEGALIFNLEKFKMPPVLLRKSNRTTTYHTRDLATLIIDWILTILKEFCMLLVHHKNFILDSFLQC